MSTCWDKIYQRVSNEMRFIWKPWEAIFIWKRKKESGKMKAIALFLTLDIEEFSWVQGQYQEVWRKDDKEDQREAEIGMNTAYSRVRS